MIHSSDDERVFILNNFLLFFCWEYSSTIKLEECHNVSLWICSWDNQCQKKKIPGLVPYRSSQLPGPIMWWWISVLQPYVVFLWNLETHAKIYEVPKIHALLHGAILSVSYKNSFRFVNCTHVNYTY